MSIACPSVMYERIDSSKLKENPKEDPSIDFEAEGGWTLSRPRYTRRPPATYSFGFTDISDAEKQVIQTLYRDARGSSEIIAGWVHPVSGVSMNVRFKKGSVPTYKYHGFGGNHRWDVEGVVIEEV